MCCLSYNFQIPSHHITARAIPYGLHLFKDRNPSAASPQNTRSAFPLSLNYPPKYSHNSSSICYYPNLQTQAKEKRPGAYSKATCVLIKHAFVVIHKRIKAEFLPAFSSAGTERHSSIFPQSLICKERIRTSYSEYFYASIKCS